MTPADSGPGTLYVVATPIGNLEDITHRAVRILSSVDLIAAEDTRTAKVLLDRYQIAKPLLSYFSYNERQRIPQLLQRLQQGQSIALISEAGTPGISDPASGIVRAAIEHGISVVPIPGAAAFVAALVVSGLPTDRFAFEGFLPVKKGRRTRLEALKSEARTIVLYESPHRILRTLRDLHDSLGDRQVTVARELTKKFEEVVRGPLSAVLEQLEIKAPRGEYVVVVSGNNPS